jgi:putative sigma-54 modulation protein
LRNGPQSAVLLILPDTGQTAYGENPTSQFSPRHIRSLRKEDGGALMQMQVTARHFKASDELHVYVSERVSKLQRYYDGITSARVVLERLPVQANGSTAYAAEISLNVYRQVLTAREESTSYEEAVNQCIGNLKRQIIRYKDKLRRKHKYKQAAQISREGVGPS